MNFSHSTTAAVLTAVGLLCAVLLPSHVSAVCTAAHVHQAYKAVLCRDGDAGGVAFWTEACVNGVDGLSEHTIENKLRESKEFINCRHKVNNVCTVACAAEKCDHSSITLAYRNVLCALSHGTLFFSIP
jgi:hypothetical protein